MLSPLRPEAEEPDPFQGFGAAELFGFIHHKFGEEGLRELLAMLDDGTLTCEFLEGAAEELEQAGLKPPAAIVRQIAATTASGLDVNNEYIPGSIDWICWRKNWLRKRRVQSGEMEADLRRRHQQKPTNTKPHKHN